LLSGVCLAAACTNPFGRHYEYEEEVFLDVDGSAAATVNTSLHALAALRGLSVGPLTERPDRDRARDVLTRAGCPVTRVGRPWTRGGRHFLQVHLEVDDIRALSTCPLLAWSTYSLTPKDDGLRFEQRVGPPANGSGEVPKPAGITPNTWTGAEIVAFRLHVPSRVRYHNVRRLDDGTAGEMERGNIATWEQTLGDRLAGKPMVLEIEMDADSILGRTLWLFFGSLAAAIATLAAAVWLMRRRGRGSQKSEVRSQK
jgi:hypothetical protein